MAEYSTSGDGTHDRYPDRPPFFAHRYVRLLWKACAAQDIGPEGCWLCSGIAHQEDVKRYSGPVTFYNEQLAPLVGLASQGRLLRVRARCVEAGWLYYRAGGKRRPGLYWVLVPPHVGTLPDTPTDENDTFPSVCDSKIEAQTEGKRSANGRKAEGKRSANAPLSYASWPR